MSRPSQSPAPLGSGPRNEAAFAALEEQHFLRGEWDVLADLYERRLSGEPRPEERARILVRLGGVLDRRGDAGALARFEEAVRVAPGYAPALRALRKAYAERDRWELVLQIAELELAAGLSRRQRAELHVECGDLWREHADDAEQALCHYQLAVADAPESGAAWRRLATTLAGEGRDDEAARAWEQAARRLRGAERAEALVARARIVEIDDEDTAARLYEQASRDDPRNREALTALTHAAARRGDWDRVRSLQERRFALAGDPGEAAHIALGAARARLEHASDPAGATPWLRRAAEGSPAPGAPPRPWILEVVLETARRCREAGAAGEAESLFELAMELEPGNPDALGALGRARWERGDLDGAGDAALARLAHGAPDPDRTLHASIAAASLEARGERAQALERWREVLAAEPDHEPARAALVRLLEADGRYEEAARAAADWADRAERPRARADRLLRAATLGRDAGLETEVLLAWLDEAVSLERGLGAAWLLRVNVLYEAGSDDEALEVSRRALGCVDDPAARRKLFMIRAALLEERGDAEAAATAYGSAAETDPSSTEALSCALHLLRAQGHWGRAAHALERFAAAAEAHPEARAEALFELGRLRAGPLEDLDGAIDAYRESLRSAPERQDVSEALTRLLIVRPMEERENLGRRTRRRLETALGVRSDSI